MRGSSSSVGEKTLVAGLEGRRERESKGVLSATGLPDVLIFLSSSGKMMQLNSLT